MGIFDLHIKKEIETKEQTNSLEEFIKANSKEFNPLKEGFKAKKFKPKGSLLSYDISSSKTKKEFTLEGILNEVLILTILVVLSILFTYGAGVIIVVIYTYYQKRKINKLLEDKLIKQDE